MSPAPRDRPVRAARRWVFETRPAESSRGSLGSVPPLRRYYEVLGLPAIHPASLVSLARRYHPVLEMARPPRFLKDLCMRALLSDPGGTMTPSHFGALVLPPSSSTTTAPTTITISGLYHTARILAVYASQAGSASTALYHARLAPGWRLPLAGRAWLPARSHRKVSAIHRFPLSQAFPGAPRTCPSGRAAHSPLAPATE